MKPTLEWLAIPEIFEINREKAHSDHTYTTKDGNLRQSLNGTWKFAYTEHPVDRPAEFYKTEFDVTGFDDIIVPGHIQLQGYDKPQYVNTSILGKVTSSSFLRRYRRSETLWEAM